MRRFYTLFSHSSSISREFSARLFFVFILLSASLFFKANSQQQAIISTDQKAIVYVTEDTEIFGQINAEIVVIKDKKVLNNKPQHKSESATKTSITVKKQQLSEKLKEEISKIKLDLHHNFSIPISHKFHFNSTSKHQIFVVHETQLLKVLGLKSVVIFDKIIIDSPRNVISSYFHDFIISTHYIASHFTRPPPRGLIT